MLAESAEPGVADVASAGHAVRDGGAALLEQGGKDRLVGHRAAGDADIRQVDLEDALHEREGARLDFVDVARALVVSGAGMALGVAMVEVGIEKRTRGRRENVLARDQVDRVAAPLVLRLADAVDLAEFRSRVHAFSCQSKTALHRLHALAGDTVGVSRPLFQQPTACKHPQGAI